MYVRMCVCKYVIVCVYVCGCVCVCQLEVVQMQTHVQDYLEHILECWYITEYLCFVALYGKSLISIKAFKMGVCMLPVLFQRLKQINLSSCHKVSADFRFPSSPGTPGQDTPMVMIGAKVLETTWRSEKQKQSITQEPPGLLSSV